MLKKIDLNFKISKLSKFKFEFSFKFIFKKVIYNKIKFENNKIYIIKLLKIIKINDVEKIKRVLKSKSSLLMINFNNDLKIDYLEIKMKST